MRCEVCDQFVLVTNKPQFHGIHLHRGVNAQARPPVPTTLRSMKQKNATLNPRGDCVDSRRTYVKIMQSRPSSRRTTSCLHLVTSDFSSQNVQRKRVTSAVSTIACTHHFSSFFVLIHHHNANQSYIIVTADCVSSFLTTVLCGGINLATKSGFTES